MNFLAHAYLSGDDKKILLGNFIGDFIKGRQALSDLEPRVATGVELHRAIDEYTDNHHVVHRSKNRLRPKYRHYSSVIVDVFYDHFLAANWKTFHKQPLGVFAAETYETIQSFSAMLPDRFNQLLPYMIRGNWLVNYAQISGIHRTLSGMASRTPYESKMDEASEDLRKHYHEFKEEFQNFFPQLKQFADEWTPAPQRFHQ
jgi:acyl carrier protein phosphodiesterase